jgi:hypothetical protein
VVAARLVVVKSVARALPKVEEAAVKLPERVKSEPTADPRVEDEAEIKPSTVNPAAERVNKSKLLEWPMVAPSKTILSRVNEPLSAKVANVVPASLMTKSPVESRFIPSSLPARTKEVASDKVPPSLKVVEERVKPEPAL